MSSDFLAAERSYLLNVAAEVESRMGSAATVTVSTVPGGPEPHPGFPSVIIRSRQDGALPVSLLGEQFMHLQVGSYADEELGYEDSDTRYLNAVLEAVFAGRVDERWRGLRTTVYLRFADGRRERIGSHWGRPKQYHAYA